MEVGSGIDKELAKGTRIAGGIYYSFLQNKNDFLFKDLISVGSIEVFDHNKYPDYTEHQVILRLAGEKEISPMVAVKMAVSFFNGRVNEDFNGSFDTLPPPTWFQNQSIDNLHWRIGVSLGGTPKGVEYTLPN